MRALSLVSGLALAVIYGLGGWLALQGQLEPGTVVTMALLLTRLYAPLISLATARLDVVTALVSFERVFEVLDIEPLIVEPVEPRPLPQGPVAVDLSGVHFTYPSGEMVSLASLEEVAVLDERTSGEVLHGVSLHIEPGQMVALVGSSGAGKSTLASLVPRLYDVDAGSVTIGGVDVRDLSFGSIRDTVGVVTQDGHLFHDTIRSNLTFARPGAGDDELWEALRSARLAELIGSLPDGLDTVVGERGYRFSGGERQRLTIARLLLARPRVVILDEATAHLDSRSEAAVQEALGAALEGRTALVIAHRLSTVRAADLIVVLENGRVVERGTHTELLDRDGRYAELYRTQFAEEPAEVIARHVGTGHGPCYVQARHERASGPRRAVRNDDHRSWIRRAVVALRPFVVTRRSRGRRGVGLSCGRRVSMGRALRKSPQGGASWRRWPICTPVGVPTSGRHLGHGDVDRRGQRSSCVALMRQQTSEWIVVLTGARRRDRRCDHA